MSEGGLWEAVYLEQHTYDLCIAFGLLIRNSRKQSSLSALDDSHCVFGPLLTEWQATEIYFPQPPWQVRSFKRKINQLWQFLAVLFHIILMTRSLIRFDAFTDSYILRQCFQASDAIKPFFSSFFFSFALVDFILSHIFWHELRLYFVRTEQENWEYAFLKMRMEESFSSPLKMYWKISLASLHKELLRPIYPLLYSLCPSSVFCGGGNTS